MDGTPLEIFHQVEELKTVPNETATSAPELAAQALDKELNTTAASATTTGPQEVKDLTSMVKKKNKVPRAEPAASSAPKRKAEDEALDSSSDKKLRVDETGS